MRIAITGAGLSGLVAARTLLDDGHQVTVFESEDEVGGVWARSRRYPGMATQNPRDTYAFSDFPMPRGYPDWPSGAQVQAYLAAYADRFGVTPHVRLRTRVDAAEPTAAGWMLTATELDGGAAVRHDADWLVIANGVFSAPHVPALPGAEAFTAAGGRLLHSSELRETASLRGRRVVVVGFAKSAADAAVAAVDAGAQVTLVYRRALWKMPKRFFGAVHLKYVLTTRLSESLFRWRRPTGAERVLHGPARRLVWLFWRGIERHLKSTFHLRECGMVPDAPIEQVVSCNLSLASDGFYEHVRAGRIVAAHGEIAELAPGAVAIGGGEKIPADVVVFGTGFRQEVPFLPADVRQRVRGGDGSFRLYRNILPPRVPRLAFIGYNSSLYSQLTSEVGARWLAEHLRGALRLPRPAAMEADVDERLSWLTAERPGGLASGTCIIPFTFHYLDDLLRDMGARTWRTRTRLAELMMPVEPARYADLGRELKSRRAVRGVPREPALGRAGTADVGRVRR